MGLNWMKRLQIIISANTEQIKIHNIRLKESEKKNIKLKNEFKDLSYNNNEIRVGGKSKSEGRCEHYTTKWTTNTNPSTRSCSGGKCLKS